MNVFGLRDNLIKDYEQYIRSFFVIRDSRINAEVDSTFLKARYGRIRFSN